MVIPSVGEAVVADDGEAVALGLPEDERVSAVLEAARAPNQMQQARAVLDSLVLLTLSTSLFERAGTLEPDLLRGLDALHLAAAIDLGDDLDGVITYDDRLAAAAVALGIVVIAPT